MKKARMKAAVKRTALCLAVTAALGTSAAASAATINFNWNGLFTMLTGTGQPLANTSNPYYSDPTWGYGLRSQISGTMSFNTTAGTGTGTVTPFEFFNGSAPAVATGIDFQAIGNGSGGPGTLVLGNMLFNWNGDNGIPVSIVLDASGLFTAMNTPGFGVGTTINGSSAGDVLPASNYMAKGKVPIGPVPIATTTWNTTTCSGAGAGSNPSGCMPLIADTVIPTGYSPSQTGIGGSPMIAGPFTGYNANFDVTSMTVSSVVNPVPIPAAVWLLGSGLLGLVGVARRKRSDQS